MFTVRAIACAVVTSVGLTGCYVIPLDQHGRMGNTAYALVPAVPAMVAPSSLNLVAKLYPANDAAAATGVLFGNVVNSLNGHGTFTLNVNGETISGEATRQAGSSSGVASATGARGSYVRCSYTMNNATQGVGECAFSSGARYNMHLNG